MARGIRVPFIADVRQFITGTKDAEKALESLDAEIADVGRSDSIDDLERDLRDLGRTAKRTGDDVRRDLGKGFDDAGQEAKQSAREAGASFRGEFEDVSDYVQEVAANAFEGFGPAGAAAGLAAAAGIGLLTAAYEKAKEAQQKLIEQADRYLELIKGQGAQLDANATAELRQAALRELGNGNLLEGYRELNRLAADGVATQEEALRILTGQLLPADYARLEQARKIEDSAAGLNKRLGASDAARARKDAIRDARELLELQEKGAAAVLAQQVNMENYLASIDEAVRRGVVAPGGARAERTDARLAR